MAEVRQILSSPQEIPTAAVSIPSSEGRIDEGSGEGQDVGLCRVVVRADDNTDTEKEFHEFSAKKVYAGSQGPAKTALHYGV